MSADLSRIRSNPLLDFSGVELKQGGVLLDADFNELVAVLDRRLRAAASDILGRATVSSTTPDAFKITASGGTLNIAKGRLYVDGLLAECHGGPADNATLKQFDPLLAEPTWPNALTYTSQPYFTAPPPLPTAGKHLVYLDVWERELTHIERPELVEVAVNVETSSRRQTVWQVRVLAQDAGTAGCATPDAQMPGWAELVAPSVARLNTDTYQPQPDNDDPCELPPTGGYRGLENQTYRVEIHDAGMPGGTATFKWSRDNASVASRVTAVVSASKLELASLGRDEVLRFNTGDWVEISNDAREQAQRAGEMRLITVDEAARTIAYTPALPADLRPANPADTDFARRSNLRVRRWDQKHQVLKVDASGHTTVYQDLDVGNSGVIKVPPAGTTLILESGITVNFSAASGTGRFHAADHWVFAARTADASIEKLANEPPRGLHHHRTRLGVWDVATGQVSDCRHGWPPVGGDSTDCACTECVTPQTHSSGTLTIQAAVDRVQHRGGGTVCIAVGEYLLAQPVTVRRAASLRIQGEGPATLLVASNGAFVVSESMAVGIEDLSIISTSRGHAVQVRTSLGVTLQRLLVLALSTADLSAAIGLSGLVLGMTIRENLIVAQTGIVSGEIKTDATTTGKVDLADGLLLSALLRIEDNTLLCSSHAINFSGMAMHLMRHEIRGNGISGCKQAAIQLLGLGAPGSSMRVCDNDIAGFLSGIVAGVDGLWIEGNKLTASRPGGSATHTGVGIGLQPGLDGNGPNECQILANQIRGYDLGGVAVSSSTGELIVKFNLIARCGLGIVVLDNGVAANVSIENNHLSDIGSSDPTKGGVAISVGRADAAAVSGNTIARVCLLSTQAAIVAGILAVGVDRLRVAGNSITDIGPPGSFDRGLAVGVMVRAPFVNADIAHNQIDRESVPLTQSIGRYAAVWIDELGGANGSQLAGNVESVGNVTGQLMAKAGGRTLIFGMQKAYLQRGTEASSGDSVRVASASGASVGLLGNTIGSRGTFPAVRVLVRGDCLFNDNRCDWRGGGGSTPAVALISEATIVSANRVRGGETSIRIDGNAKAATVLGNITTGDIELGGSALGTPWAVLNVRG